LVLAASPTRAVSDEGKAKNMIAWERLLMTYASSLTIFMIDANRCGFEDGVGYWGGSEIVSPAGEVLVKGAYHEPDAPTGLVDFDLVRRERIHTPLLRDERLRVVMAELNRILSARQHTSANAEVESS
jgi:predicted amidohydrolase